MSEYEYTHEYHNGVLIGTTQREMTPEEVAERDRENRVQELLARPTLTNAELHELVTKGLRQQRGQPEPSIAPTPIR